MAETFKRAGGPISSSGTDIYTAPATSGSVAIILSCSVANITSSIVNCTCDLVASDGTSIVSTLIKEADLPAETALELVQNKIVLEAGERLKLTTDNNNNLSATVAILEITP